MTILDFLIIYLACGSPFAVHSLVTRNEGDRRSKYMAAVANVFLWPWTAVRLIHVFFRSLDSDSDSRSIHQRDLDLARIRSSLENAAAERSDSRTVFEFRDVFQRYSGLSLGCEVMLGTRPAGEIFEITSHPDPSVASACLDRKNLSRLQMHRDHARQDFIGMILRINGDDQASGPLLDSAVKAAELARDTDGVRAMRSLFGISDNYVEITREAEPVVDLWKPAHQKQ